MKLVRASGTCNTCGRYAQGTGDDNIEATMFLMHNHEGHRFEGEIVHDEAPEKPTPLVIPVELQPPGKRKRR